MTLDQISLQKLEKEISLNATVNHIKTYVNRFNDVSAQKKLAKIIEHLYTLNLSERGIQEKHAKVGWKFVLQCYEADTTDIQKLILFDIVELIFRSVNFKLHKQYGNLYYFINECGKLLNVDYNFSEDSITHKFICLFCKYDVEFTKHMFQNARDFYKMSCINTEKYEKCLSIIRKYEELDDIMVKPAIHE